MNELIEQPQTTDEINIRFVFVNGDTFEQPLTMSHLDGVEDLMAWFRNPKGGPIWTWLVPSAQKIHMLHRIHIMCIDIDGYIEPEGDESKWYQKWMDKLRTRLYFYRLSQYNMIKSWAIRDLKGGEYIGEES